MSVLKIKRLYADARLPERANPTDSGVDVFIHHFEKAFLKHIKLEKVESNFVVLRTNDRVLVNTGISCTVGPGFEIQVRPRSGNALKRGLIVVNSPGTIDANYRGMIGVIIANTGHDAQQLDIGEKIAQLVVVAVELPEIVEVEELDDTDRGSGGFGSTGK